MFIFNEPVLEAPSIALINLTSDANELLNTGRCVQLFSYDVLNMNDLYLPTNALITYQLDTTVGVYGYDTGRLAETVKGALSTAYTNMVFKNWQFIDSGFRNDNVTRNKRYREVQFQLNNTDGVNLDFGLEFQIDGQPRLSYYTYDIEHVVDYSDPNYGLIYIQQNVDMNVPMLYVKTPGESVLGPGSNSWILNQSMFPDLSLWRVRAAVSGKGTAPRLRLVSRNTNNYELMGINWVYRTMNAR
jgi:hypothetical protein